MLTKEISYIVGGKTLTGYLAAPDGAGKRAGVLVCHQGMGITEHTRERAQNFRRRAEQRTSRQTALLFVMIRPEMRRTRERGVGDDQRIDA